VIDAPGDGLYDLDTRILSRYALRLDGRRPRSIGSCVATAGRWRSTLVLPRPGGTAIGPALPQDTWAIHLDRRVGCGMTETITVRNESMVAGAARLTIDVDADVRDRVGTGRGSHGPTIESTWNPGDGRLTITGRYRFRDAEDRRGVAITFDPPPSSIERLAEAPHARRLGFDVALGPREAVEFRVEYASLADGRWRRPRDADGREAMADAWRSHRTRIRTADTLAGPATERAAEDLLALRLWEVEPAGIDGWVVTAGVPSFTGFFGRDAITAGWQAALLGTEPLRGALEIAATTQGQQQDPLTEEEPGRMVHEMRRGPLSMLGVDHHRAYYGSHTTGSIFVLGLSELWHWTGDDAVLRRHADAAMRVIEWAESFGDVDGDGFLEYRRHAKHGLKNQGWKDSDEAIRYPDGSIVPNPIATVEEQAFHFLALQRMAEVLVAIDGPEDRIEALLERADRLAERWHDAFWLPEDGFYALALDPAGERVATIASNVGHALASGIVPPDHAAAVADRLLAADLFSGWGVRTLSTDHPSFNPFAYHLGSVWPVENATIALGFKRYGLDDHLLTLVDGVFAAIAHCRDLRLPEALTGHDRRELPTPLPYPRSQSPQAWSASATIQLVQLLLGLYPFAPAHVLALVRPRLPEWLPSITLEGLRIGDAVLTIRFDRETDGAASHRVVEQRGRLSIVDVPPPDAVAGTDGLLPRLLEWVLERAPGRTARALRIAMGDTRR
jgi:glycogen debranching enzyme